MQSRCHGVVAADKLMRVPVVMETSHAAQAHAAQHASVADALATAGSARDPVDLTCPR